MARRPRCLIPGGIYHVTTRGNRKQAIFCSDGDRRLFLEILRQVGLRFGWTIHAYCLMETHYHLLLETPNADLSRGMQRLNSSYAQAFNATWGFVGHLFQGRFHATVVESDWHFLEAVRYVLLNPVRAGLCASPAEWPWSNFRSLAEEGPSIASSTRVLELFGRDQKSARTVLLRFLEEGMA